ncbi:xylose isomerase-like protein [Suillus fuscotomentosus]|uniref:Apurinic-apyrimidinic endonuclease 1 n=1 Tax=Suillus fuscotomentosus TaxID=1912939 RepID=A0AAD4HKR0_9AGAM|nr:xylose isomerase-like protein [Suillus fuscotomentosus]KAG1899756.1 xylose isomerase-like protein [Suillus fuscotomentosus]
MVQTRRSTAVAASIPLTLPHFHPESSKRRRTALADESDNGACETRTKTKDKPLTEDFPVRVSGSWKIGAHVSAAGGVENAVRNAAMVGANAFALFVKSQRKWDSAPLSAESVDAFKRRMQEFGYSPKHVLPHGSYLVNLGNPDGEKRQKSFNCFLDDLQRCEQLGLELYNFHPGSTVGQATKEESIALIAECINNAHKLTKYITIVIENMAGSGNVIGSQFSELKEIINHVENKTRVGVCLDTCHAFAAVRASFSVSQTFHRDFRDTTSRQKLDGISAFDTEVGLSYLKGLHLNDSKAALGGHLGISTFRHIVSDPRTQDIPLILETPTFEATEIWTKEISALNRLSLVDDSEVLETELSLVNEITSLVRSHAAKKTEKASRTEKASKTEGVSKTRTRKRNTTEDQDYDSDCA